MLALIFGSLITVLFLVPKIDGAAVPSILSSSRPRHFAQATMSKSAPTQFRPAHGSTSGRYYPRSPRSIRLLDGIEDDTEYLKYQHHDLTLLDYGIKNVGAMIQGDSSYDNYRKLTDKEKLMFSALFRRAARKSWEGSMKIPPTNVDKAEVIAYNMLAGIQEDDRERDRLSKLMIVKIVSFTNQSFETEFLPVINQLKVLNEKYSTSVPLMLVSNYCNTVYVEKLAKKYTGRNLTVYTLRQPLYPLVNKFVAEAIKPDDPACKPESPQQEKYHFCMARKHELTKEQMLMLPNDVSLPDWYNPGEVYALCEQVQTHHAANDKDYLLLLNSGEYENVVDMRILNYLCESRIGSRIDFCFEATKPSESNLNMDENFLVNSGGKLTVIPGSVLKDTGYNLAADDMIITKNMWISIPFLKTEPSDVMLLKLISDKVLELKKGKQEIKLEMTVAALIESQDAHCIAIQVPTKRVFAGGPLGWLWDLINPTLSQKLKLNSVFTYFISYICYHLVIYLLTSFLHVKFLKTDNSMEDEAHRKKQEENFFWTENAVWLVLVFFYISFLTFRRVRMAKITLSPQERQRRSLADASQAMLLAITRFLYAGLNRMSEVRGWCGGNPWRYLFWLHLGAFFMDFVGSVLIMLFIDPPNVMEPLESS